MNVEQMTVTVKVQILATSDQQALLNNTLSAFVMACNDVSEYIFRTKELKQTVLNKALYHQLRAKYGLKAQMAQSVIKTVIARYKTILANQKKWIRPDFRKPQYDLVWNRDYSLRKETFSVNTLCGRIRLMYTNKGMEKYFDNELYRFGTAKLVQKHGKYFLHIPVTFDVEENKPSDVCNVVGIDRGINFIVATYGSDHKTGLVRGRFIKQKRAHYSKVRQELQKRQTASARRRIKAMGQRENRWMQDVNHQVSKALVEQNPKHTLFVLEDLTGIRKVTEKLRTRDRYVSVSWSFYDLEQKLIYKAKQNQSSVVKVSPRFTSQCCPVCGHIEKSNRNKKKHLFVCKKCGYTSNDDRIAAMNLYRMGINYLYDNQVPDTDAGE